MNIKEGKINVYRDSKKPAIGGLYRHFKGGLYQVITIARREADREVEDVIYKSMETGEIWSRELSLFMSPRDAEKYPDFEQYERMRFMGMPVINVLG